LRVASEFCKEKPEAGHSEASSFGNTAELMLQKSWSRATRKAVRLSPVAGQERDLTSAMSWGVKDTAVYEAISIMQVRD